jgi:integrase
MATFKICVFKNKVRSDGRYRVSIRVCWKRKYSYISTEYYVTDKQINKKNFALKDIYIINDLNKRIAKYEDLKSKKLGQRIEMYTAKELADYFVKETRPGTDTSIDFIAFARQHIERLRSQGRTTTASNMSRTLNALIDFANGRQSVAISEITAKFLEQFETFLRGARTIKRKNQLGKMVTTKSKGLSDVSVFDYMTDMRVLFNAALNEYNDEDKDEIRIIHYPFRKYKLKKRPDNEKRNLTAEQIAKIARLDESELSLERAVFSRDIFMLSFYMVGMNLADLYHVERIVEANEMVRINYNRKKTKGRRQDKAFISILVEPEAMELLQKYRDRTGDRVFNFYQRYSDSHTFSSNVNKGLKVVAKACKINEPLSTYYARHSWATIARNRCSISKDDIDLALNHVDSGKKMADVYIEKDWAMLDIANRKVLDYVKNAPI